MYQHIKYFGKGGGKTFQAKDDSYRQAKLNYVQDNIVQKGKGRNNK
jgi:hypothetical protein